MSPKANKSLKSSLEKNSKELLLCAARKIFGKCGFDQASTREIAQEAGVNISLISYHFQGKDGLYRACLEELGAVGLESVERVLKTPQSEEELKTRLQIFIEEFIKINLTHPENCRILMRELINQTPSPAVLDVFKNRLALIFERLVEFMAEGQKKKLIAAEADPEILAMIIMGSITHVLRTENVRKILLGVPGLLEPKQIDNTISQLTNNLLYGILKR